METDSELPESVNPPKGRDAFRSERVREAYGERLEVDTCLLWSDFPPSLAGFAILVANFSGHSTSRLLVESTSTDGRLVAEVREVVTPVHGGPDSVQVALRPVTRAAGDVIYSQVLNAVLTKQSSMVRLLGAG